MVKTLDADGLEANGLEPIAQDVTSLGGYAYRIIRQQSQAIFKLRSPVLKDTDIEDLHQMRVGTRRLQAALSLFTDVIKLEADHPKSSAKSGEMLVKSVKPLTRALGRVRDLDVMEQWLSNEIAALSKQERKKERKTVKALLKKMKKRRKTQFSKMEKALTGKNYKKLKKRCKQWLKQPYFSAVAQQSASSSAVSIVVVPLVNLLQHPGWKVATCQQGQRQTPIENITLDQLNQQLETNSEQLHGLRKQIKQTRYQTEFFRSIYDINYAAQVRELRSLQKVLGEVQDQLVIAEFLTTELGEAWAEQLPTINQAFQSSRLALWQQWQPLQTKYLKLQAEAEKASA